MSEPQQQQRRRRRPAVSCTLCRKRKIKCNLETPCSNCVRSRNHACEYEYPPVLPHRPQRSDYDETSSSTTSAAALNPDMESMRTRITYLENQLKHALNVSRQNASPAPSIAAVPISSIERAESVESRIGGVFYIHHGNPALDQSPNMHRTITHKKRMYGQSHWMTLSVSLLKDIVHMIDGQVRDPDGKRFAEKVFVGMQRCKQIARVIKAQREPPWPCPPTSDLPPKQIADDLVDCYLRTHETVYRILHVPSFRRSYDALWMMGTESESTFLVQLKLVLAIGAASYNDTFTLRPSAMRWVHEAETWLANPHPKHRLDIQYIQIYCLQLLAREAAAVGEDMVFLSTGTLLRSSMFLGLHRDPSHLQARTVFANEMHRRLWSTILEICLQTSLYSGCPPLICMDDFDTQPPGNFDDDQLEIEDADPRPDTYLTQASVSKALRKTFPARLAVIRFLNNFASSGTYEETLRLDSDYRISYKDLRSTLRAFDPVNGNLPSDFQIRAVDTIMNRYLCALHTPFFMPSLKDTKYTYSRKTVFDTALKMWYANFPEESLGGSPSEHGKAGERDDFQRVVTCGHGFLRSATMQSVLIIAVEMRTQLQEDDSLGPTPLRRDLFAILEGAKAWSLWCMEAGETNVKGHVFMCIMLAYTRGLAKRLGKVEIAKKLVEAVEVAEECGMALLEKMLKQDMTTQEPVATTDFPMHVTQGLLSGWETIIPGSLNDPYGFDTMNWAFDEADLQTRWLL
ncbi:hypothetical protein BU23DRAFT_537332 [Bimuria novae-zelandiae CBS 107.79]|uniref:Zn(2)-C6 fungal-type domain-containing protein n=1 Tax=Bimuria novae-zelandiae CBS 107.79 TaxID=1447943 RepID=A0A6A5V2I7_9PLEO|nr:hypothetical protein BU23DRAFT_537332 [Bimuria novae-zelandiae CBS 107.79]